MDRSILLLAMPVQQQNHCIKGLVNKKVASTRIKSSRPVQQQNYCGSNLLAREFEGPL